MTQTAPLARTTPNASALALHLAANFWFSVAALGHWIFFLYILGVFGPPLAQGGLEGLESTHLPGGFIPGDDLGNRASAAHVLLAAVIVGGGPLQLVPQIRAKAPTFHRWLGRTYAVTVVLGAVTGAYMVWTRGSVGGVVGHVAISLDAALIVVFAVASVSHAIRGRFERHRRWALRLFLAASAVWFLRVGLMAWAILTGGVGMDFKTFTGPFIVAWQFGQYAFPLLMLELYFRAKDRGGPGHQALLAGVLVALTTVMAVGIFGATTRMWLPKL